MNPLDVLTALSNPATWARAAIRVGLFIAALVILIIGFAIAVSGEGE